MFRVIYCVVESSCSEMGISGFSVFHGLVHLEAFLTKSEEEVAFEP